MMKHKIIYVLVLVLIGVNSYSQNNIDDILTTIEQNNTTLSAYRSSMNAEMIGNKTGNYLQNPEIELAHLWSSPIFIGNRTDIAITQGFDFPTAYKYRSNISDLKNQQLEIEYRKQLRDLNLEVRNICLDLIYFNSLKGELEQRKDNASITASSYKTKYELGDCNILEYNKAKMIYASSVNELKSVEIEIDALLSKLKGYNAGIPIEFTMDNFPNNNPPENFDNWYSEAEQNNPVLNWIKQGIEVNLATEKYSRAMSLPKFKAGFIGEYIIGERFQGFIVGMSVPLWENKNSVKYAKENTLAFQDMEIDRKLQFYSELKVLHTKAIKLKNNIDSFRKEIALLNNLELAEKALNSGEISLIEYVYEFSVYYESKDTLLKMELELNKTVAELNQYS